MSEQTQDIERNDPLDPFWMVHVLGLDKTPMERLREENESLKQQCAAWELRYEALTKLIDLEAVNTLLAERADLYRLLGLRGEVVSLEQQIEQREKER